MKRIFALLCAVCAALSLCFGAYSAPNTAEKPVFSRELSAESAILINAEDGSVYYEKNAHTQMGPASTTKLMTALVALELAEPERIITVPREAVGTEGSSVYLCEGEKLTLTELIYALLLSSANDAAVAIAVSLSGSVDAFADEMNSKAKGMGLADTHFVNPHGLYDDEHYTTAADLAKIAAACLENELIAKVVATKRATIPHSGEKDKRLLVNHNKLLSSYDGAIGMKTGFTKKTGRTLVSAARRDGLTLIAVTLNAPSDWQDHSTLFDFGFGSYERVVFYPEGAFTYTLPVSGGEKSEITLTNKAPLALTLPKGTKNFDIHIESTSRFTVAPVNADDIFGTVTLTAFGQAVSSELYYTEDIKGTTKPKYGFFERIFNFFKLD